MLRLGTTEWILIVALVLLFFGPSRLPSLGKSLADGIRNLKKGLKSTESELKNIKEV